MIELRWKLGRANKGSASIPKKLQYRYCVPYLAANGNMLHTSKPEWSRWIDVPYAAHEPSKEEK